MANVQNFDKLNNVRSMPFEDYFGEMGISDEEKARRIALAEDWDSVLMYILALFDIEDEQKQRMASESLLKNQLEENILDAVSKYTELDDYVQEYVHEVSNEIIDTTIKHSQEPYYLSTDRVQFIAEDQANTLGNYIQFKECEKEYKYKTWRTMADEKVRQSHYEIDGMMIEIDGVFNVGGSLMRFPKDTYYGAEPQQYINCRCWLAYS